MHNRAYQLPRRELLAIAAAVSTVVIGSPMALAQGTKIPRVAVIVQIPGPYFEIVMEGLAKLGYVSGQNIIFEPRFAEGQPARVAEFAAEMARLDVDLIVAIGAVVVTALRRVTSTIPIVFVAVIDPVGSGFVSSVDRPGGNITGVTSFDRDQPTKQLEMLKQVVPTLSRVTFLSDEVLQRPSRFEKSYEDAATAMGIQPHVLRLKGPNPDFDGTFAAIATNRTEGLVTLELPVTIQHQERIAEMAAQQRIPALFPGGFAKAGGLITYGTTIMDTLPHVPEYVDRILRGERPAEMPIRLTARRELIFNLRAARATGVTIPRALLERADRVVD